MAHRVGVCGSCRARFQIPSTFLPNRARCRACGGVVEIGPAQGPVEETPARPENRPAAPVAPIAPVATTAPVATIATGASIVPVTAVEEPAPTPAAKRNLLVPVLVAAGIVALLVFGAFQLLGKSEPQVTAQTPAPPAADGAHPSEPSPPAATDDAPAPR